MAGDSVDVTARTYHTENGVTDAALLETLRGCGFIHLEGWTPEPPIEPPPPAPVP